MHSSAAARKLTVSSKASFAKECAHFRHRPSIAHIRLGGFLTKNRPEACLTPYLLVGEPVRSRAPLSLFQLHKAEYGLLASRVGRRRRWFPSSIYTSWNLAEDPYTVELTRMGRRTIVRSQAAELKQKRQLRDAGDAVLGPAPSGEQVIVDKGTSSPAEENNQPSGLSGQADKMPSGRLIHLEARLAIFQKEGNLEQLTVAELKGILKLRNRPSTGRKQDLLEELKRVLAEPAELGNDETATEEGKPIRSSNLLTPQHPGALRKRRGRGSMAAPVVITQGEEGTGPQRLSLGLNEQQKLAAIAKVSGEDSAVEGIVTKVYRSRRAKARDTAEVADLAAEPENRVKRAKPAGSVELKVKAAEQPEVKEIWATFNHKKPQPGWYAYDPSAMRPPPPSNRSSFLKIMSWNVNGLRALLKGKDTKKYDDAFFRNLAQVEDFDILCLQETKLQDKDVDDVKSCLLPDFAGSYWSCSTAKLGYSGTAIISRVEPLSVHYGIGIEDHDKEGRVITAEFETFYLVTSYVPNSGDGLRRLDYRITSWDPAMSTYLKNLEKKKPVIFTGDLNCCHQEMDIADPYGNRRSAGFTNEERCSFAESYLNKGLVDTFRRQHPNVVGYTYWGYRTNARARNHGWRVDYFLASESLCERLHDSYTMPHILGSDHCPIGLILGT